MTARRTEPDETLPDYRGGEAGSGESLSPRSRRFARWVLAGVLIAAGLWVARGFLVALGWAVVIGIALWPAYVRLFARPGRVLPAITFTLIVGIVLLGPLGVAAFEVVRGAHVAVEWIAKAQQEGIPQPAWLAALPLVGQHASAWWQSHLGDPQGAGELFGNLDTGSLARWTHSFVALFADGALTYFIMLVALFFLFRDGAWLGERLLTHADRALGDPGERLVERMVYAVRGTVNGTVWVALGEGVIIGAGYAVFGVPHPVLFALFTSAFAMLPMGAWFVFTVAALTMLLQAGAALAAAGVFAWGVLVMMLGDNFIQPRLIGGYVRLPFLWALIGILGGIQTFGLLGLFLGPVVMAALMTIWREWIEGRRSPMPDEL